jgi:hypothetical protein
VHEHLAAAAADAAAAILTRPRATSGRTRGCSSSSRRSSARISRATRCELIKTGLFSVHFWNGELTVLPRQAQDGQTHGKLTAKEHTRPPFLLMHALAPTQVWNLRSKTPSTALTTVPWHQDIAYLCPGAEATPQPTAWIPLLDGA